MVEAALPARLQRCWNVHERIRPLGPILKCGCLEPDAFRCIVRQAACFVVKNLYGQATAHGGADEGCDHGVETSLVTVLVYADEPPCTARELQRATSRCEGEPRQQIVVISWRRALSALEVSMGRPAARAGCCQVDEREGFGAGRAKNNARVIAYGTACRPKRFQNDGSQNTIYVVKIGQLRPFGPIRNFSRRDFTPYTVEMNVKRTSE